MDFIKLNKKIPAFNTAAADESAARWDAIAKPLRSLGLLEESIIRIAGITGMPSVHLTRRGVIVLCSDNGVVAEGISQSGCEVTKIVAENLTKRQTSVCRMAAAANADVIPVDMGMASHLNNVLLLDRHIADGTNNIAEGPAMTEAQTLEAIKAGIELVESCCEQGYDILATGEMGIGNTTTSSAVASVLLCRPPADVTGRGAGLSDEALERKIKVIQKAIDVNKPDPSDALDVLAKLGGFDIAGLAGIFIGGALYRIPIIVDGIISAVSALVAARLCPACQNSMLASHVSREPSARILLDELSLKPLITAEMSLGEGTGAVAILPLLDLALAVYHGSSSFSDIGIDAYKPQ